MKQLILGLMLIGTCTIKTTDDPKITRMTFLIASGSNGFYQQATKQAQTITQNLLVMGYSIEYIAQKTMVHLKDSPQKMRLNLYLFFLQYFNFDITSLDSKFYL